MVMTLRLHDYPVKALVDRDVENVRVLADAELDVAGYSFPILEPPGLVLRTGRQESQFLSERIDDLEPGLSEASTSEVDVPFGIHRDAVAPRFLAKVTKVRRGPETKPSLSRGKA